MEGKILLVDDEEKVLSAIRRELINFPFEVYYASDGFSALKILSEVDIEVVVSDENMPGMKGSELIAEIKKLYPEIISIIVTGTSDISAIINSINKGDVYRYLLKPWNHIELVMSIKNALEKRMDKIIIGSLKNQVDSQVKILEELESKFPGITKVNKSSNGDVIL